MEATAGRRMKKNAKKAGYHLQFEGGVGANDDAADKGLDTPPHGKYALAHLKIFSCFKIAVSKMQR